MCQQIDFIRRLWNFKSPISINFWNTMSSIIKAPYKREIWFALTKLKASTVLSIKNDGNTMASRYFPWLSQHWALLLSFAILGLLLSNKDSQDADTYSREFHQHHEKQVEQPLECSPHCLQKAMCTTGMPISTLNESIPKVSSSERGEQWNSGIHYVVRLDPITQTHILGVGSLMYTNMPFVNAPPLCWRVVNRCPMMLCTVCHLSSSLPSH